VVICLERGADLHMAHLMPLPLTVSCFSKIQIGFTFLVPAHLGSPGQRAVKNGCVCVCCTDDIGKSAFSLTEPVMDAAEAVVNGEESSNGGSDSQVCILCVSCYELCCHYELY